MNSSLLAFWLFFVFGRFSQKFTQTEATAIFEAKIEI